MRQPLRDLLARTPLKWKAAAFISLLVLAVGGILSLYFLGQSGAALTGKFEARALALTENLADNSRNWVSLGQEEELQRLVTEAMKDPNVLHAVLTDGDGAVLAQQSREDILSAPLQSALDAAIEHTESVARSITNVAASYHGLGAAKVSHMAAPIRIEGESAGAPAGSAQIIFSMESTHAAIRRALITGVCLTAVIVLAGILIAVFSCGRALSPIQEMARAAAKIGEGDLSQRVPVRSRDEIGVLAGAFNHMAESLDDMTRGLEEKVRQRTEALAKQQEELREVNLQLERATQHKSEFVANMSHELRTPLNAVIGFSEVLLEKMFGPLNEKQEEYINDILSSGRHLLSLINDILDLSKVEAGKMELDPSEFDLRQVIEGSLVMVKERALNHGIRLAAEVDPGIGVVFADERKVKQIIFNLLSNAVKFTPDRGSVSINAALVGEEIQIAVRDTGVGIPQSEQDKIFEEFHQVASGLAAKSEGTGLGLTLCKRFAELHGGRIWVQSTPGQGSTFSVAFPRSKLAARSTPPALDVVSAPADAPPPAVRSGLDLLLVEPEPQAAETLLAHLREVGYTVELATDEAEGMQKARSLLPRAVVIDILHHEGFGFSFLEQLKRDPATHHLPVIVAPHWQQQNQHMALSADDYVAWPIDQGALESRLSGLGLHPRNAPVRILAIDDDPRTTELLAASLGPAGFEVLQAGSGPEGIEMACQQRPDLIILDLLMPGMNGYEVIEKLEQARLTQQMPIILFTVKHLSSEERQRLKGRIAGIAEKGAFNKDALVSIVGRVLQRMKKAES